EIVRSLLRLGEGEDQQEVTRKICHGLEDLGMPPDTSLPLLLALLGLEGAGEALRGLDGEIIGARTRAVLQGLLQQQCHSAPAVLCLEDLHWIDTASEALLRQIMQSDTRVPLLLLCSSRPPYQLPWAGRPHVTALPLAPLSEESTLALVKQCLGTDALPEELAQLIGEKTEGNPLFAEEITRYLLESGILRRTNGRIAWQPVGQAVQIPATLQDLLLARVDGLAEAPRALLQVAAVLGHRFPVDLLRTIYGGHDDTFAQCLQELEAHDLIARQETEGRAPYQFTHVLIQDTLYTTLLTPRREVLHQRVGEAIERHYPAHLSEWVDVLAHHWCRTARVDKAVHYLALAGEKNLRVYALVEAHACFRQVVESIESAPRGAYDIVLADVLLHWGGVHYYQKDFKGLIAVVEHSWSRLVTLDDKCRLSLLCFWLGPRMLLGGTV